MLKVTGKPGRTLLELFIGGGPGAIAAARWGMNSYSIERESRYLAMLAQRVRDERSFSVLALMADQLAVL
jgi:hypothetical protein